MKILPLLLLAVAVPICTIAADDLPTRRPPATLATLPAPAAAGPLRILLVDDDFSDNNHYPGDKRVSLSDQIFRKLAADAAGSDAAWAVEAVKPYESGPGIDRLRKYSLILWYTGASYGGNPDNTAVLSIEDEKTVRRYLEEVGGVVVLFSPGYAGKVIAAGETWEKAKWPFLSEVLGIRGGQGLAQRFQAGTVKASDGAQFSVGQGNAAVETQFSIVNPDSASVLFTTTLANVKGDAGTPVATIHPYGQGRIAYVGFTFENLAQAELTPAFNYLLGATGLSSKFGPIARPAGPTTKTAATPGEGPATVQVSGTPSTAVVTWTVPMATVQVLTVPGAATTARRAGSAQTPEREPTVTVERLVPNAPAVRLASVSISEMKATDPGPLTPGQALTYRVTLTNSKGATGSKEATFTPPPPKDPDSLSGAVQADGSVILTWPEVPGVARYQVSGVALTTPVVVSRATQWRSAPQPPGPRQWKVASVYDPGQTLTAPAAWPSHISRTIPTPRELYLKLPNGPGSHAESIKHYRTQCLSVTADLSDCRAAGLIAPESNWEAHWLATALRWSGTAVRDWPRAVFNNTLDLGAWRFVNCAPRRNGRTVCWATSHHGPAPHDDWNTSYAPGASAAPKSLSLIILLDDNRSFFGSYEFGGNLPVETADLEARTSFVGAFDMEHSFAKNARPVTGAELDSQGRKGVPHACLSCHGGRYDAATGLVIGASLLPVVPSRIKFFRDDLDNGGFWIAPLNAIIKSTNPAPAITAQIDAMYAGRSMTDGTRANDVAIPPGWSQQPGLYKQVILPYCSSCHFAQRGTLHFGSFANLLQNKQRVQKAVCTDYTMPHSEILFRKFWSEGGAVSLPGLLSTAMGYASCP